MGIPHVFGWQHLTYLAIFIVLSLAVGIFIVKYAKTEKRMTWSMRIIGIVLLLLIIWNRIAISIRENDWKFLMPDSWCGAGSFTMAFALMFGKKDNKVLHYITYMGFVGAMVTMIYPNFLGQTDFSGNETTFMYPATISGLLHHSVLLFAIVMVTVTRYFTPTLKKWYYLPLGMCMTISLGIFEITAMGFDDAMLIMNPILPNTILTWWFLGILIMIMALIIMAIYDYILIYRPRQRQKKDGGDTSNQD